MKTYLVKPVLTLALLATYSLASAATLHYLTAYKAAGIISDISNLYHESKQLTKSYPLKDRQIVVIANKYGNVTVSNWDRNEVSAEIRIDTYGLTIQQAKQMMDQIEIKESVNNDSVSFSTEIRPNKSPEITYSGKGKLIEISYIIHIPQANTLKIRNEFGKVNLDNWKGQAILDCAYTDISADKIDTNSTIKMRFGSLKVNNLEAKNVEADMVSINVLHFRFSLAKFKYCKLKIANIAGSGSMDLKYCPLVSLGSFSKEEGNLSIRSSFSDIRCGDSAPLNVKFDVQTNNSKFDYDPSKTKLFDSNASQSSTDFERSKYRHFYKGNYGTNPNFTIRIIANSGDVKFL